MAIPFSNTTQRIPPGFANLLEGLAREVLRNQPDDIPTFAAKYFESLLIERESKFQWTIVKLFNILLHFWASSGLQETIIYSFRYPSCGIFLSQESFTIQKVTGILC